MTRPNTDDRHDTKRHTQGYLGAMNTCPSDSKLFGSSDSKSATERGRLSRKSSGQGGGEWWVNSSCSSEVQGRRREFTIATLRYHGNTSVSQYGAKNRTWLSMDVCFSFTSTHTFCFFLFVHHFNIFRFGFNLKYFGCLRTDLRDVLSREESSQTDYPQWVLFFRSGRHQHGQLLQGRWVKVLMEVVTPQTGRGEGSERHIIRGSALHCEGHVERATSFHLSQTEQSTKYQPEPQQVSLRQIQRVIFSLSHHDCVQQRNEIF